jgi:hypothetical protein
MTSVEVAVLSTSEAAYDAPDEVLRNASAEQLWLSRTRVAVDVSDQMLVGEIVDTAAERLSIVAKHSWWARELRLSQAGPPLWFPDVRDETKLTPWDVYVDSDGAAHWWFDR